jgi:hypothetical protein
MLFERKPMSEYGNMGKLLLFFDVETFPKIIGQIQQVGYVETTHYKVVINRTKKLI